MKPPASLLHWAIVALVLLTFPLRSMSADVRSLTERRYYDVPVVLRDSVMIFGLPGDSVAHTCVFEARGAMAGIGERQGLAPNYWGMDLIGNDADTLRLTMRHGNTSFGDIFDKRQTLLSLVRDGKELFVKDAEGFGTSSGAYNTLCLEVDRGEGVLRVSGGGRLVDNVMSLPVDGLDALSSVEVWSRGELTLSAISLETEKSPEQLYATRWSQDELTEHFRASEDGVEGYWRYLDRENDPQYARPGGRYLLAVVRSENADGEYDIVYVDGAETRRDQWRPMMLKGRLKPTIFVGHYDLEWIDSTFAPIDRDIHATITDGAILTLSFPLLKTTLRFSRMPLK